MIVLEWFDAVAITPVSSFHARGGCLGVKIPKFPSCQEPKACIDSPLFFATSEWRIVIYHGS